MNSSKITYQKLTVFFYCHNMVNINNHSVFMLDLVKLKKFVCDPDLFACAVELTSYGQKVIRSHIKYCSKILFRKIIGNHV